MTGGGNDPLDDPLWQARAEAESSAVTARDADIDRNTAAMNLPTSWMSRTASKTLDGPHLDGQIAAPQGDGPTEPDLWVDTEEDRQLYWFEIAEVDATDVEVIEAFHAAPDQTAWMDQRMADLDVDDDAVERRPAAEVGALQDHFTAARDHAMARLVGDDGSAEQYTGGTDEAADLLRDQGIGRAGDPPDAGLST